MGLEGGTSYPFLIAEMVNLTCLGEMTREQVLCFRTSEALPQDHLGEFYGARSVHRH